MPVLVICRLEEKSQCSIPRNTNTVPNPIAVRCRFGSIRHLQSKLLDRSYINAIFTSVGPFFYNFLKI
ncbi:hypothetical protein BCIN_08g04800 [Botrytis cinerea B05.10]|uniref:Uncharacterized protein n=1 Tax=Botryotinia fuckeliana (strain B05.10) TaxID=332648 RepID=A0A384JQI9_BOTFB|nr:hypothetical protein BCIN_08g04800 [Botrytis cinerea B05.10]ATZ52856.1 hypothetical protein BCIN_08g04800 [Botrytis cinerea B05.10]